MNEPIKPIKEEDTSYKPYQLCDNVQVSGAYCAKPPVAVADPITGLISPRKYYQSTALCKCVQKGKQNNQCQAVAPPIGNTSSVLTVCKNKFGCQQPLFPSMLGRRIEAEANYTLNNEMCRCNGGSDYGLDVKSRYCNKFAVLYQRRTDPGYYTSSTRWNLAQLEYDHYTKEIVDYMLSDLKLQVNKTMIQLEQFSTDQKFSEAYLTKALHYELLVKQVAAYTIPVREFVCSMTYPRCARCDEIVEEPIKFFNGNQENFACFDPTTCRSLCKKIFNLHGSFSTQFKKCVIDGECTNVTSKNIFHSKMLQNGPSLFIKFKTFDEICASELICPWRSMPGHRQYDNSLDALRSTYEFSPLGRSFSYLTVFAIIVVILTVVGWIAVKYIQDIWKQRRQFGASDEIRTDTGIQKKRIRGKGKGNRSGGEETPGGVELERKSTFAFDELMQ